MNAPAADFDTAAWIGDNQFDLGLHLARVRAALRLHLKSFKKADDDSESEDDEDSVDAASTCAPEGGPFALEFVTRAFGLSEFERDVLVLCAGIELESALARLCGRALGDETRTHATWSLALAALSGAHWSALLPDAPLRKWQLLQSGNGANLMHGPLRISERVLHFLCGLNAIDEHWRGLLEPSDENNDILLASQNAVAQAIAIVWRDAREGAWPVVQLCGADNATRRAVAHAACEELGCKLRVMNLNAITQKPEELDTLWHLWQREARLEDGVLLIEASEVGVEELAKWHTLAWLGERAGSGLMISLQMRRPLGDKPLLTFEIARPTPTEQRVLWRQILGDKGTQLNGYLEEITFQFDAGAPLIRAAAQEASATQEASKRLQVLAGDKAPEQNFQSAIWGACRRQARPRLDELAQRLEARAGWDDLILPEAQFTQLQDIAAHVRCRCTVYERWGFGGKGERGLGLSALFAGTSGTGKTLAAEVLGNALNLDVYRIDLSTAVSKYIGETEKNLARIFDAAETGGAILLFDEADALFGKRSEVKDSHDRHANIEVGYLLQRMESYRGLAILTTNLKHSLDPAFLRRLRFVINFPFPDAAQRTLIWTRAFPKAVPKNNLDEKKLAQMAIAGGNIRNVALNAAFLAAAENSAVGMKHLLRAAQSEYDKLEKTLTDAETRGWIDD